MKLYNLKRDPFNQEWDHELSYAILQIPTTSPYICNLPLIPRVVEEYPSECKFLFGGASLTETSSVPSPGEFRIDYLPESDADVYEGSGQVLFNSSNAGEYVIFSYQAVGSVNLAENIEDKRELPHLRSVLYQYSSSISNYRPRGGYIDGNQILLLRSTGVYRTNFNQAASSYEDYFSFPSTYSESYRLISGYYEGRLVVFWINSSNISSSYYMDDMMDAEDTAWTEFTLDEDFTNPCTWYSSFVQIGSFIYVFCEETAFVIDIATLSIQNITAPPVAWQWGTAIYDNTGYIYLLGNLESDNIGKCYRYNIFEDSYEELFTLDSSIYYINGGIEADGYLHFLEYVSTSQLAHNVYDIQNNKLYRYYSNINDNEYGSAYSGSVYKYSSLFKATNGESLFCWALYSSSTYCSEYTTDESGTSCTAYSTTYNTKWLLEPLKKYRLL